MKKFYLPALSPTHFTPSGKMFFFLLIVLQGITSASICQKVIITPGTSMSLNGSVFLVANNIAFQNKGALAAGTSTVKFTGHQDTLLVSYVSGINPTSFYNLTVSKSAYGMALKLPVIVQNVLDVNGGNLYTIHQWVEFSATFNTNLSRDHITL